MALKVYQVNWKIPEGGPWVPFDPVCGGEYNLDKYGKDIITATSGKMAQGIVKRVRRSAVITKTKVLATLSKKGDERFRQD